MTRQIAKHIAHFFCNKGVFSHEDIDTYIYGYELMLISIINWGAILIIMCITNSFVETILYMVSFIILRHHTGGYHAKSHKSCFILSVISYLYVLVTINVLSPKYSFALSLFYLFTALVIISIFSPVEHKNLPVSAANQLKHRKYSLVFSSACALLTLLFLKMNLFSYSLSISSSLFQVSISLLLGVYNNKREEARYEI